jgi:anti-sigma-K factor RskA
MRKRLHRDVPKVEEALIRFHRRPIEAETDRFWQKRVMHRIREEGRAAGTVQENSGTLGKLIWRFAVATSLLALLVVGYAVQWDSRTQYELAQLDLTNSVSLELVTSFGDY